MTNPYEIAYQQSIEDPDTFWAKAAEDCHWYKKWDQVLDDSNKPFYRWFSGGEVNTCYNALDLHIENGRGDQNALIYDSPVTQTIKKYTYNQLRDEVARFAGVLAAQGVAKGDRVLIYMPMIAEALVSMLAAPGWVLFIPWCLVDLQPMNWRCASTTPNPKSLSPPPAASR